MARGDIPAWISALRDRVFPTMSAHDGFLGVQFLTRQAGDPCRVTVLAQWASMDAARGFAGDTPARAVVPDVIAPFFVAYNDEATFHDDIFREAMP